MGVKTVKFGGSSLADASQFRKVCDIIKSDPARRFVVPSAPGKRFDKDIKITDMLYKCNEISLDDGDFSAEWNMIKDRYDGIIIDLGLSISLDDEYAVIEENIKNKIGKDYAASRGEYLNGIILAEFLGFTFIDAADVIKFNSDKKIDMNATTTALRSRLVDTEKAVIPGFYGSNEKGIVTFSRGGSDVTGSLVAMAVRAEVYENWTDVSGFLMADPRIVENPEVIDVITYKELRELAYMGASVLHEDAIFPVRNSGIPINIKNTNDPTAKGTMIVPNDDVAEHKHSITGIAGKKGFVNIFIEKAMMNNELGFCRKVLQVLEDNGVSFEHMPSGIDTMSVIIDESSFEISKQYKILSEIKDAVHPDHIALEYDISLIAVVGYGMRTTIGTAARVFKALSDAHVNIKMLDQGSSELNIIIGINTGDFETAIRAIYKNKSARSATPTLHQLLAEVDG